MLEVQFTPSMCETLDSISSTAKRENEIIPTSWLRGKKKFILHNSKSRASVACSMNRDGQMATRLSPVLLPPFVCDNTTLKSLCLQPRVDSRRSKVREKQGTRLHPRSWPLCHRSQGLVDVASLFPEPQLLWKDEISLSDLEISCPPPESEELHSTLLNS